MDDKGFDRWADDYNQTVRTMEKAEAYPFAGYRQVLERIYELVRAGRGRSVLQACGVTLDPVRRTVCKNGVPVPLTPREYDLLLELMRNKNAVLYRNALYERVWGEDAEVDSRTLDLHIQRLRKKLGLQAAIKTVYKIGYELEDSP